jgi:serine/threonine protein kinase
MEYFPYGDLGRYIAAGFTEADTKIIATQLLEGLEIMHVNDFAHRDLKPQVSHLRLAPDIFDLSNLQNLAEYICCIKVAKLVGQDWRFWH